MDAGLAALVAVQPASLRAQRQRMAVCTTISSRTAAASCTFVTIGQRTAMTRVELCEPVPRAVPRHRSTCRYTGCRVTNNTSMALLQQEVPQHSLSPSRVCVPYVCYGQHQPLILYTRPRHPSPGHPHTHPTRSKRLTQALSPHRHVQLHSAAERTQSRTLCDSAVSTPLCRRHTVHASVTC